MYWGDSCLGGALEAWTLGGVLEVRTLGGVLEVTVSSGNGAGSGADSVSSWNGVGSVSAWNGAGSGVDSVSSWNGAGSRERCQGVGSGELWRGASTRELDGTSGDIGDTRGLVCAAHGGLDSPANGGLGFPVDGGCIGFAVDDRNIDFATGGGGTDFVADGGGTDLAADGGWLGRATVWSSGLRTGMDTRTWLRRWEAYFSAPRSALLEAHLRAQGNKGMWTTAAIGQACGGDLRRDSSLGLETFQTPDDRFLPI